MLILLSSHPKLSCQIYSVHVIMSVFTGAGASYKRHGWHFFAQSGERSKQFGFRDLSPASAQADVSLQLQQGSITGSQQVFTCPPSCHLLEN